jgi:uncharacterized protein (DUF2236 family)
MTVERDDLERHLATLMTRVGDRRAGLYGPGSVSWDVNREGIVMLGGGCAALMQLAHPFVAHGVEQHSDTKADPIGRFTRTFGHVFQMVFGDVDSAVESARRVHALHRTIRGAIKEDVGRFRRGDRYQANDERALLWVHATLVDTAMRVYELVVRPLSPPEHAAYYAESRLFAYLFGIPDEVLPPTWEDFLRWYDAEIASDTIAVGAPALEMRRFLFRPPSPALAPISAWLEVFTAGLLPEKLREQFGFAWGPVERQVFARSIPLLRLAHRATPGRIKYFPAYVEACRRLEGKPAPDVLGRALEGLVLRGLMPRQGTSGGRRLFWG